MTSPEAIAAAAERLIQAQETRTPCAPVRDLIGSTEVAVAYQVQDLQTQRRLDAGGKIVGRKVGLTSKAVQAQIGVDQPDFGVLFDDMWVATGSEVPTDRLLQPKAEAELAFVLKEDLVEGEFTRERVVAAVDYAVAAIEIVASRVQNWDITFGDTVADNGSSGMFILGDKRLSLANFNPVDVEMVMTRNGEQVSSGNGAACLGDPLNALTWLAETLREHGVPLRAGMVVLSGALGPMAAAEPGDEYVAHLTVAGDSVGSVTATFSA